MYRSMSELPFPAAPTGNRFALVTPDTNSAPIIIVTILSLIFSFLVFTVRLLVVKWRSLALDDALLTLAHVSSSVTSPSLMIMTRSY